MEAPSFLRRHRWLRWLAPAAVLGLAAITAAGVFTSGAPTTRLPRMSPEALIASLRSSPPTGYSGTVVSRVSFGLPELPDVAGAGDGTSFASLLSGSHTLQVWYGGAEEQRVAVLGATDETDLFRYGRSVWLWDSANRVATHTELPQRGRGESDAITGLVAPQPGNPALITPGGLVRQALAAIRPSTTVQVRRGAPVADRSTYDLVLTPRSAGTLVGSVRIALDGATKVPLAVRIYPRGSNSPAIDVAYTSINYGRLSRRSFQFAPPAGAHVHQVQPHAAPSGTSPMSRSLLSGRRILTAGRDWSAVGCYRFHGTGKPGVLHGPLAQAFVPVAGDWGRGRLLEANLVSVLLTRDGWACAGTVQPSLLYSAVANR
jgi:hypothetical protein